MIKDRAFYCRIGKMGGRPRLPTLEEIETRLHDLDKKPEHNGPTPNSLTELTKWWREKYKNGNGNNGHNGQTQSC